MAGDKMIRLKSADEVRECVKSVQDTAFVTNGLTKTSLEGDDEVIFFTASVKPGLYQSNIFEGGSELILTFSYTCEFY